MRIFISYRRAEDSKSYLVGTIHERLAKVFGEKEVFRDIYNIAGGADWRAVLGREINSCKVMLVIIGPDWASLEDANGQKRLFDEEDVTRWEVQTGLERSQEGKATVIPVLVLGARVPKADELPDVLRPLLEKHGVPLRNFPDFDRDMEKLVRDIRGSQSYAEDDISIERFEPKTIYIAEGSFLMGSEPGEGVPAYETPPHPVNRPAYRIGKYPVTNRQYEIFIRESQGPTPRSRNWIGKNVRDGMKNLPVSGVTWQEALAYCEWLKGKTGRNYCLPNEAQWEKACRGGRQSRYPWGDEFEPTRSNHGARELAPVNAFPAQNDYGLFDLLGNVRQWTTTLWGRKLGAPDSDYVSPWQPDGRDDLNASRLIRRVIRGTSFAEDFQYFRCSSRIGQLPDDAGWIGAGVGFRVVLNV